ncbi:hypothetical protein C8R46DRAFT_1116604 [Mycena filopes]|nr:hypothetical protein C8R46DRAFT_1116604 [Mycena filopes]
MSRAHHYSLVAHFVLLSSLESVLAATVTRSCVSDVNGVCESTFESPSHGPNPGAIIGAFVGVAAFLGLATLITACVRQGNRRNAQVTNVHVAVGSGAAVASSSDSPPAYSARRPNGTLSNQFHLQHQINMQNQMQNQINMQNQIATTMAPASNPGMTSG